jgi:hypothetical protein
MVDTAQMRRGTPRDEKRMSDIVWWSVIEIVAPKRTIEKTLGFVVYAWREYQALI